MPSSVTPAVNKYSWKSSLPSDGLVTVSDKPGIASPSLKNRHPNSSKSAASSDRSILYNTLICASLSLFAAKNTFNEVAACASVAFLVQ